MKANIKISVMLMAMTIGTLAASAQSARRGHSEEDRKNTSSQQTANRSQRSQEPQTVNRSRQQSTNSSARRASQTQRSSQSATVRQEPARNTNRSTNLNQQRNGAVQSHRNASSTTTNNNPRSNYREVNRSVHVGNTSRDPKGSRINTTHVNTGANRHANHGIAYHDYRYYPNKKVTLHVHPITYNNHYRVSYYPRHREIIWSKSMYRTYLNLYPGYTGWHYPVGYRIQTISAFDAKYNVGEVSRVYGRVYATWYNKDTDDLLLFFGGEFPYQEFTMVIPGRVARRFNWRPERYFLGQHVMATGLISRYDGKSEMIIKEKHQLDVY